MLLLDGKGFCIVIMTSKWPKMSYDTFPSNVINDSCILNVNPNE